MSKFDFPAFFFPSAITVVDDNTPFLELVPFNIKNANVSKFHLFQSPVDALKYFEDEYHTTTLADASIRREEGELHADSEYTLNLKFVEFRKEIYNKNRFNENSIVIADYFMHTMDGISMCQKIMHLPVIRILITAEAEKGIAVEAFNAGIIHYFLLKNDPQFYEKPNNIIIEMQKMYFYRLSKPIVDPLSHEHLSAIGKPGFTSFFEQLCHEFNIVEFYLLDAQGSALLLDANGNPSWIIIKSKHDIDAFLDMAKDSQAPSPIQESLASGKMLAFFATQKDIAKVEGKEWEKHAYLAQPIPGMASFYYSHITNHLILPLQQENIASYNSFIQIYKN